jgi:hypothetical protein
MNWDTIWQFVVGPVGGAILSWGIGKLIGEQRWNQIRQGALILLGDQSKPEINQPDQALAQSLVNANMKRLSLEVAKVQQAFNAQPFPNVINLKGPDDPGRNGTPPSVPLSR